jgi:hypothetical protein
MARWQWLSGVTLAIALGIAGGCGGQSKITNGDSGPDAGDGGTTTTGGTGGVAGAIETGGTAPVGGTGGAGRCYFLGDPYEHGTEFVAPDGCNTCICINQWVDCTLSACVPVGNCDELAGAYRWALEIAKWCGTECETVVTNALQCGCPTHVNEPAGIERLGMIADAWNELGCGGGVTCGACPDDAVRGYCSTHGSCIEVPAE